MFSYERLSKKPLLFKSFTGLTVQEFDDIYDKKIAKRYGKYEIQRLSKRNKDRERNIGAGRPFKLDLKNRFFMLLVYYRLYITYTLTGFLFDLDQSNIYRDIQKIEGLVRKCIPTPQKIYPITKRLKTPEEVEKYFPGFLAFIDSTEQQIPRPVDKKRSRHDYDVYKNNHPMTPKQVVNVFDLGYRGVEKDFPEQLSALPHKRNRKQEELPQKEKEYNKIHSKKRIIVENTICRLKKYRIMSDIFRNKLRRYNKISDIVSGLVN